VPREEPSAGPGSSSGWPWPPVSLPLQRSGKEAHACCSLGAYACGAPGAASVCAGI